jgi:CBS domain containing-hemolysin-like protein
MYIVKTLLFIVLLALFLSAVLLDKAYKTVSVKELRRRARSGKDKSTASIYKLIALGGSLKLFLWLIGTLSAVGLLVIIVDYSMLLAGVFVLLSAWLALSGKILNTNGILWKTAALISVPAFKVLNFLHPVLSKFSKLLSKMSPVTVHTGLYDKEDLLDLINTQNHQLDNRIDEQDLKIVFGALTFGNKLVRDIMTPRRAIKLVAASDTIGPLLMDELYKSGFSRFPVVKAPTKEANPEIIGTLYLKEIMAHQAGGKVADVMKKGVNFINESQNLREALGEFLKTQHHLLVVMNDFNEIAGIVSLEDVMEQVLGQKIVDESVQHEDLRAEALEQAEKEQRDHHT